MIWIDAHGVVAMMTHEQVVGNWAKGNFITYARCLCHSIIAVSLRANPDMRSRFSSNGSLPKPAWSAKDGMDGAEFVNFLPKTFFERVFGFSMPIPACFAESKIFCGFALLTEIPCAVFVFRAFYELIKWLDCPARRAFFGKDFEWTRERGIMGLHRNLSFLVPSLGTFSDVAGAISIGSRSFILPYLNEYS